MQGHARLICIVFCQPAVLREALSPPPSAINMIARGERGGMQLELFCTEGAAACSDEALGPVARVGRLPIPRGLPVQVDDEQLARDHAAIELWLAARCGGEEELTDKGGASPTARVYRREAERFLLWLATRGTSLSQATLQDCLSFRQFLADPQPAELWCAPRGAPRGSSAWRPFEGPLSVAARRHAITVLRAMFSFLRDQLYLNGNAWAGVKKPRSPAVVVEVQRSLSADQWSLVLDRLATLGPSARELQLDWLVRFLQMTGLRLAEAVGLDCDDFRWVEIEGEGSEPGVVAGGWVVGVNGKGGKFREVPVPTSLVDELSRLLLKRGGQADLLRNVGWPVLARFKGATSQVIGSNGGRLSAQATYRHLKAFLVRIADGLMAEHRPELAAALASASTHWLRHTYGAHSVAAGVGLDVVRANLGHASLAITSLYTRADITRRIQESRRLR